MLPKFVLLLPLLIGLSSAVVSLRRIPIVRISLNLSNEPLIQAACRGNEKYESECNSVLESASISQKNDANGLAFFALRYVEDHAVNLTDDIKKAQALPNLTPMLQAALTDCMDQYNSLDDLIEDAINALLANVYDDTQKFIDAAVMNIDVCHSKLNSTSQASFKFERGEDKDTQLAINLSDHNCFLKSMLSAASSVIKSP